MLRKAQAARLLSANPQDTGSRLLLLGRGTVSIGSAAGASLRLERPIAKRHAAIHYHGGRYFLTSLEREGLTFVNDAQASGSLWLKHGDNLRFGAHLYRFIDPDAGPRRRHALMVRFAVGVLFLAGLVGVHAAAWDARVIAIAGQSLRPPAPSPARAPIQDHREVVAQAHATPPVAPASAAAVESPARPLPVAPHPAATPNLRAEQRGSWIEQLNHFRTMAGLAPIAESPELSASVDAHAHYLMDNFVEELRGGGSIGTAAYQEDKSRKGYSSNGAAAAANSQIGWGCGIEDQKEQIDRWIAGPFHRVEMLSPGLKRGGFGEAASDGCWVAALRLPPVPNVAGPYPTPVMFPPGGSTISIAFEGGEYPDPLASCPDYKLPTGLPITLQIGRVMAIDLGAHSLTENDVPVKECAYSAKSYNNPDKGAQEYGRWALRSNGAVTMIPRAPLKPGAQYKVSIVANGRSYTWSFQVASDDSSEGPRPSISVSDVALSPVRRTPMASSEARSSNVTTVSRGVRHAAAIPSSSRTPEAASLNTSTVRPTVNEAGSPTEWLDVLNNYRALVQSRVVVEDASLSRADLMHVKYLFTNYGEAIGDWHALGAEMHQERPGNPGFSPEGLDAARHSDVVYEWLLGTPGGWAIEWWMATPFHRPSLLNPFLERVGYANECHDKFCAAALDAVSGLPPLRAVPYAKPLLFPPDGARIGSGRLSRGEWPNPSAPCPGFRDPGMAITLMLGINVPASLSRCSIEEVSGPNPGKLDVCSYDFDTYRNSDQGSLERARKIMKSFGEVVLIPKNPLDAGANFHVEMSVNGEDYEWSFAVEPERSDPPSQVHILPR